MKSRLRDIERNLPLLNSDRSDVLGLPSRISDYDKGSIRSVGEREVGDSGGEHKVWIVLPNAKLSGRVEREARNVPNRRA